MAFWKNVAVTMLVAALAGCGGGGGSAGTTPGRGAGGGTGGGTGTDAGAGGGTGTGGETPTAAVPASLEIFSSSATLNSASDSTVTFTVLAKDSANRAIPNQPVEFTASSGNLLGAMPSPTTGSAGEAIKSVQLSPGANSSNRDIVVTAKAGAVTQNITIPVVGTSLSVQGSSSVLLGASTTLTVKATDSGGKPINGGTVSVKSARGNALFSTSNYTTNPIGSTSFSFTGINAGVDTLTIAGLGTTATVSIGVTDVDFSFVQPATNANIAVGSGQTVQVRLFSGGVAQAGTALTFSTTRGSVVPTVAGSTTTDANGLASARLSSATAGPASVTVQTPAGAQIVLPVTFVAVTPATLALQANPTAVQPNSAGSTANQSTLVAVVRDAVGNPVAGRTVTFTAVADTSAGSISPGTSVTDQYGTATAQFIPGARTTAADGVELSAAVSGTSVVGTTRLTVSGQALFIAIGVGNSISNYDQNTYEKEFSVSVTDANGAAVAKQAVSISVFPTEYRKGVASRPSGSNAWSTNVSASCANEDIDRDGILDPGEDISGDGLLTPGMPAAVAPASVITDDLGFAKFSLRYGENYAGWLDVDVIAKALVGGTESRKSLPYALAASAADVTGESTPAFVRSPFGLSGACNDAN